jgi:TetR/AcrR family transcriptional regulator
VPKKALSIPSRERILEAASVEFAAHGYAGARIGRIAHRCRLNVRMLYYHFASKEGLYRAVLRDIYERMAVVTQNANVTSPNGDHGTAVDAFSRYCDLLAAEPRFADILVRETLDGGRRLKALFEESPDLFERVHFGAFDLVRAGVDQHLFRPIDPSMTVLAITSMVTYLTATRDSHRLLLGTDTGDATAWKQFLTDLVVNGLKA